MTTVLIQVMLFVTLASEDAFNFMLNMTSALSLIPFVLAAGLRARSSCSRGETYDRAGGGPGPGPRSSRALATVYTVFLLFAAGPKYMLLSFIIYAPGTILFVMARREQGRKLFSPPELVILAVSVVGAVIGVVAAGGGLDHGLMATRPALRSVPWLAVTVVALATLAATACGSDDADTRSETLGMPSTQQDLEAHEWVLSPRGQHRPVVVRGRSAHDLVRGRHA